jgi:hypothetical protein
MQLTGGEVFLQLLGSEEFALTQETYRALSEEFCTLTYLFFLCCLLFGSLHVVVFFA